MPTPKSVLDLGANIGLTAAHYRYLWPGADVVAVEMDPGNAELARLNAPDATVREEAVAAEKGVALDDDEAEAWAYALGASEGRTVMRRTLRSIVLREFGKGGVDFVKMDIEGEEWNLLSSVSEWAPLVRQLVVELHERSRDERETMVGEAIRLLESAGFQARHHPPHPTAVYAWR